jgi:hypothetical protein
MSQNEFGQGRCVFESLYYGLSGVFTRTLCGPSVDRPTMVGGQSARVVQIVSALAFHIDRSLTVRVRLADRPCLTFSDSTDMFQTDIIVVNGTVYRSTMGTDRPRVRRTCASCT